MASIKLTRFQPKFQGDMIGYILEVKATAAVGMPKEIFVYHRGPLDPDTNQFQDIYEAVCSPAQIDEIPPDKPFKSEKTEIPYFRTDTVQFVTRTIAEMDELWSIIQEDVISLAFALTQFENLQSQETIVVTGEGATIVIQPLQVIMTLVAQPSGLNVLAAGIHTIGSPDDDLLGWLPAASAPGDYTVPAGGKFFYNIDKDTALKDYFPLVNAANQVLQVNGVSALYGTTFVITDDTIWWLNNTEEHAPWPFDWISPSEPGSVEINLRLVLVGQTVIDS